MAFKLEIEIESVAFGHGPDDLFARNQEVGRIPILAFAPNPWDDVFWMNRQHILSRLAARGWPVVYSMGALNVWQRAGERWRRAHWLGHFDEMDGVLVDRPGRIPPRWQRSRTWDTLALRYHAGRLIGAHSADGEKGKIAFLFHPQFWPYVEYLEPCRVVLHLYDVYWRMGAWTSALQDNLEQLVERADLLTASSEAIANALPGIGVNKARVLPNAVDLDLFLRDEAPPCPRDLQEIPRPRIANLGQLNRKIDYPLIAEIARRKPDWHWVLVGGLAEDAIGQDPEARNGWDACKVLANVHYLGEKPRRDVPAYAYHMDINVICYRIREDDWVVSGYPNKLHEYLAVGHPVIAAPQESIKTHFSHVVDIADSVEEWIAAIRRALNEGGVANVEVRRAVAMENSWDKRLDLLERWLFEMIGEGGSGV